MYLIFDTETTGLPQNWKAPLTDYNNWPRCVQLAWQLHDLEGKLLNVKNYIIKPEGYDIPFNAEKIHGISTERANNQGMPLAHVLLDFINDVKKCKFIIGHNISFDNSIIRKPTQNTKLCLPKLFQLPTTSSSYQLSVLSVVSCHCHHHHLLQSSSIVN
mgnify:CR=1 FL=1